MGYPIHPLAELLPPIEGAEFDNLVLSIKVNGLRDAITIHEDQILDGRNRRRACEVAGVDPVYVPLPSGADPVQFIIDKNINRRHLSDSQRAMFAAKIAAKKPGRRPNDGNCHLSQREAAKLLNVTHDSVTTASQVHRDGVVELRRAVEQGSVSLRVASELAELDQDEQRNVVALGPKEVKAKVKVLREKKTRKRTPPKPRGSSITYPVEDRHLADLHRLEAAWEAACDSARREFISSLDLDDVLITGNKLVSVS